MNIFRKHYQDAIHGIASPAWLQIRCDLVRNSLTFRTVKPMLIFEHFMEQQGDGLDSRRAGADMNGMMEKANNDADYRKRLVDWLEDDWLEDDWLKDRTDTAELHKLVEDYLDNGTTFDNDEFTAERIQNLNNASTLVRPMTREFRNMEKIRQLAIMYGAEFKDIAKDTDLSQSYAWCADMQDVMCPADLRQYDEAVVDRDEDQIEATESASDSAPDSSPDSTSDFAPESCS